MIPMTPNYAKTTLIRTINGAKLASNGPIWGLKQVFSIYSAVNNFQCEKLIRKANLCALFS